MRPFALLALAALLAGGGVNGCATGCSEEMEHGGANTDASPSQDGAAGSGDAAPPFCPDAGPPPDASPYDASPYDAGMFDAGVYDAGPPPDAGPICRYPWDAGPDSR